MKLEASVEEQEGGWGLHGWQMKAQRNISVAVVFLLRSVGSKPQAGLSKLEHQNQEKKPNNIQL